MTRCYCTCCRHKALGGMDTWTGTTVVMCVRSISTDSPLWSHSTPRLSTTLYWAYRHMERYLVIKRVGENKKFREGVGNVELGVIFIGVENLFLFLLLYLNVFISLFNLPCHHNALNNWTPNVSSFSSMCLEFKHHKIWRKLIHFKRDNLLLWKKEAKVFLSCRFQ